MKSIVTFFMIITSASVLASAADFKKVRELVRPYIDGSDVKVNVIKIKDGICGAIGPSYIAKVAVRRYKKDLNSEGQVFLKEQWNKIGEYGITHAELASGERNLMAKDQCLE